MALAVAVAVAGTVAWLCLFVGEVVQLLRVALKLDGMPEMHGVADTHSYERHRLWVTAACGMNYMHVVIICIVNATATKAPSSFVTRAGGNCIPRDLLQAGIYASIEMKIGDDGRHVVQHLGGYV